MESESIPLLAQEDDGTFNEEQCAGIYGHNDETVSINMSCGDISDDDETCLKQFRTDDTSHREDEATIDLTTGKKFHLFISFSSEDREIVKPIVEDLEKRCFRCMYADRDFEQGDEVTNNIVNRLQESMKMLLMLTPNFINSGPCSYEARKAEYIYYLMENRQNCIIPIMLLPCDVPVSLKSVTYIDATRNDVDLVQEITEAFQRDGRFDRFLPNHLSWPTDIQCGETVVNVFPQKIHRGKRGLGQEYRELREFQIEDLKEAGLQEAVTSYDKIRKELNSIPFSRFQGYSKFCCCCCCFLFLSLILLTMVIAAYNRNLSVPLVVIPVVVLVLISCGMCYFCHIDERKRRTSEVNILKKFADTYIFKEKFLIVKGTGIDIIKYDTTPCLNTTKSWLKNESPDMPEDDLQNWAKTILKNAADEYIFVSWFSWHCLPRGLQRHQSRTSIKRACLCELARVPQSND